jgi:hypothetical protein
LRCDESERSRASLGAWPLDEIAEALTQAYTNLSPPRLTKNPPYIAPPLSGLRTLKVSNVLKVTRKRVTFHFPRRSFALARIEVLLDLLDLLDWPAG